MTTSLNLAIAWPRPDGTIELSLATDDGTVKLIAKAHVAAALAGRIAEALAEAMTPAVQR